jgi:YHS domain-containing protein
MKILTLILVIFGLAILVGCEKKAEPTVQSAMDSSQSAKETTEQTARQGEATVAAVTEQTTCPVMEGNPINKELFVEYKGKKVYFCCSACISEFNKDPEKYVSKLPQFKQ